MAADPITYCLERVSDYRDFERLCSALLAGVGYFDIDPLGGTGDEGRDAIIRSDSTGRRIGFAYTVRSDWRKKLAKDCVRVQEMGHGPDVFVFVCTSTLSASEKDFAHKYVKENFSWTLDLFDLERLRVQIVGAQRHLIARHPSIFSPPFFPQRGGQSISESRDTLLIDHVPSDHALATWLARRLSLAGYPTWCYGTAPLAGENADDTIRKLLETRASQYLPILTLNSLQDGLFLERCVISSAKPDFVLPCMAASNQDAALPTRLRSLTPADFIDSWNTGLSQTLARLQTLGIRASLSADQGRHIALGDYLPTRVITAKPEPVYANVFPLRLPKSIMIFDLRNSITPDDVLELRKRWAFVELGENRVAAFTFPPIDLKNVVYGKHVPEFLWQDIPHKYGKRTVDLAKELAWRSIEIAGHQKGLRFCNDRNVLYFPKLESGEWTQPIRHVDGRLTRVQLTGERTKGWGERASRFLYQLAPRFRPQRDIEGNWSVIVSIYIRVTTSEGVLFEGKEIGRRRKAVSKGWWNKEWLMRLLGIVQALQNSENGIQVGDGVRAVVMGIDPLTWLCPVGIDVMALSGLSDIGEEIANYRSHDDEDDWDDMPHVDNGSNESV